jgi:uncharacterized protein (UPF0276 family)
VNASAAGLEGTHGVGLRVGHYADWLAQPGRCGVVEAISENFVGRGGRARAVLEAARRECPVVLHGVSLSIGGPQPIDWAFVDGLRRLAEEIEAPLVSDHLCFGATDRGRGHDLWPLPQDEVTARYVAERVMRVQDRLGRRIALENVSSYARWSGDGLKEWEMIALVAELSDSLILLDLNNVVVNAANHGFDPLEFVRAIPGERVAQLHLSGHRDLGAMRFDDHGSPVPDEVWALYKASREAFAGAAVIVEWDGDVPPLERVIEESGKAMALDAGLLGSGPLGLGPWSARRVPEPEAPAALRAAADDFWAMVRGDRPVTQLRGRFEAHRHLDVRLKTYVEGYWVRQREALEGVFHEVAESIGPQAFGSLCRAFLAEHPSEVFAIEEVGARFPAWLALRYEGPDREVIAGLAEIGSARSQALLAPDPPGLASLAEVEVEEFGGWSLDLHPSLRRVGASRATLLAWSPARPEIFDDAVGVVLWRKGHVVRQVVVGPTEDRALELALGGASVDALCGVLAGPEQDVAQATVSLSRWVQRGWLARWNRHSHQPETRCD